MRRQQVTKEKRREEKEDTRSIATVMRKTRRKEDGNKNIKEAKRRKEDGNSNIEEAEEVEDGDGRQRTQSCHNKVVTLSHQLTRGKAFASIQNTVTIVIETRMIVGFRDVYGGITSSAVGTKSVCRN